MRGPGRLSQARRLVFVFLLTLSLGGAGKVEAGFFSELLKLFSHGSVADRRAAFIEETEAASQAAPILESVPNPEPSQGDELPLLNLVQGSSLVAPANPLGTLQDGNSLDRIFLYTVKPGDTPSAIAKSFGVSVNTILWANNIKSASSIRVGDQLVILPVSGVKHVVKKGETVDSIAKRYKADAGDISAFNGIALGGALEVGTELMIPDGEFPVSSQPSQVPSRVANLPQLKGYFVRPIQGGRKSQGLHGQNGVDLANSCGTPILASAAGEVLISRETGYNGGFGKFIVVNHPNGTQTVYAHNQKNMVVAGEEVTQGQIIGLLGNTGNTRGATGCHVHFEIHGAKNPF
ncbi:MAG: LysM peptidoglycan-binding domain-containing protein [Candidatus Sungbacteria bacterium]|nr:LysM peptidoglycan-binding domain-containing protein [Candidatus Sungbacteria bacterium]